MKAILIDPFDLKVAEVDYSGDFHEIYKLIHCGTFDCVRIDDLGNTLFVDDEGLIKGSPQAFFVYEGYPQPLAGYALLLGSNESGDTIEAGVSLEEASAAVTFVTPASINGEIVFLPITKA